MRIDKRIGGQRLAGMSPSRSLLAPESISKALIPTSGSTTPWWPTSTPSSTRSVAQTIYESIRACSWRRSGTPTTCSAIAH